MSLESAEAITDYLRRHRDFEECVLEDVRWLHFGTTVELVFDYIWDHDGTVRPEYAPANRKTLVLRNVQELHVWNALSEYMVLHPNELNWGLSEVSSVRLVDDEQVLGRYALLPIPLHQLRCNWEHERRVDVVFSTLDVR